MKVLCLTMLLAVGLFSSAPVFAHIPLCSCCDNGDGTITCEGGFSDGSSAAGMRITVRDKEGNVLIKSRMNEDGEFTIDKPAEPFKVIFDAGRGHRIEVDGEEIDE